MNYKRIIPCLDLNDGRVVKGINFVDLKDAGDPIEMAMIYQAQGADELVLLDITATKENRDTTLEAIKAISNEISIPITVGGGIRSVVDFQRLIKAGANKVSISSAAVSNPSLITDCAEKFGSESVVVAIDVKKQADGSYHVYIEGGGKDTGLEAQEWAKQVESLGAGEILLTSMDGDGTKTGYDLDITKNICDAVNIPVIASGGAGKMDDFLDAFLVAGAEAALAASLFHFKEVDIRDLKEYLMKKGINVRIMDKYIELENIKFDEKGLVPTIVQEQRTKEVLMLAYMNKESLKKTIDTGQTWFWSRSRQELWNKGASSGHRQYVKKLSYDCDADTILVEVEQVGVACHTGAKSCFFKSIYNSNEANELSPYILEKLYDLIADRKANPVEGSYTNYLFREGIDKILKKVGEESAEVIIAAKNPDKDELIYEASDLIYHLLVLLNEKEVGLDEIYKELKKRAK